MYKKVVTHDIRECFQECSSQDKIETLKSLYDHNEKRTLALIQRKNVFNGVQEHTGVKECLQQQQLTPFQTLVYELKNTVMDSYWNKEVGKTRYQIPHLPIGMDPLKTTFGMKTKTETTMTELLHPPSANVDADTQNRLHELYQKSYNNYYPSEQINRNYRYPFDKNMNFGEHKNIDYEGSRIKNILTWINKEPDTMVSSLQADFMERTQTHIGEVRNSTENDRNFEKKFDRKAVASYADIVPRKPNKREKYNVASILRNCPVNDQTRLQKKYLEYVNTLRQKLKKREIPFTDIYEELYCLDKQYKNLLPKKEVFRVLRKHHIYLDEKLFEPLLEILKLIKNEEIDYKMLVNVLNWKCAFPPLSKMNDISVNCQYYISTYNEMTSNIKNTADKNIRTAGISSERLDLPYVIKPRNGIESDKENLGDQTSAGCLISPSIFTRHGLSHRDLFTVRNKEEIRSIFENIGIKFPDNSFEEIWQKGLKRDCTGGVCVETFKNLLDMLAVASYENIK